MCAEVRNVAHVTLSAFATQINENCLHIRCTATYLNSSLQVHRDTTTATGPQRGRWPSLYIAEESDARHMHDVLGPRVLRQCELRQILAVTRPGEATVRHLSGEHSVGSHPDAAEVQFGRHPHRGAVVGRPHARRESVLGPVRKFDRFSLGGERLYGDNRPEYLFLDQLIFLLHPEITVGR